LLTD